MDSVKRNQEHQDTGDFDPLSADYVKCPYEHYKRLRETCPVAYSSALQSHFISRSQAIRDVCKNPKLYSNEGTVDLGFGDVKALVTADDPLHRRQRNLVNLAFTPRRVAELEPYIAKLTDDLIDGFIHDGHCDLVRRFSLMIPGSVICKMMGVPFEDFDKFQKWTEDGIKAVADPDECLEQAMVSALELAEYIIAAAEERRPEIERGQPRDDLITALVSAEYDGENLTNEELFLICWQLLTAGHETTASLISSSIYLLNEYPDQKAKLLSDPSLIEQTIEEVLRFESPAQTMPRIVTQDTEIAGVKISANTKVNMLYASANRDPGVWEDPEKFDITRPLRETRRNTMTFGYGSHSCLGSNLARLEGRVALGKLLERIPNIEIDQSKESERALNYLTRGWKHLWVKWPSVKNV